MIGTREGYLVGLSLGISLVSSLESPNPGADLPGTLLGTPLGLWFGSEAVKRLCCWRHLMDYHEDTWWGVGISCVPTSGSLIKSTMNSVRYFQLLELLTLEISTTLLIPYYGGRWRSDEVASSGSTPFALGMNENSSKLNSELSGWVKFLGPLMSW